MSAAAIGFNTQHYGAAELKHVYERNLLVALAVSIVVHAAAVYMLGRLGPVRVESARNPGGLKVISYFPTDHRLPTLPDPKVGAIGHKQGFGVPTPIPDERVTTNEQPVFGAGNSGTAEGEATGEDGNGYDTPGEGEGGGVTEELPPPIFRVVEKEPQIVRRVVPRYPEIAARAGLEGKVWVKVWVDREGKVRQALVLKSDNDIFNDAAVDAAKQFLFTPAYMSDGPVSVWVAMPFTFRLVDSQ